MLSDSLEVQEVQADQNKKTALVGPVSFSLHGLSTTEIDSLSDLDPVSASASKVSSYHSELSQADKQPQAAQQPNSAVVLAPAVLSLAETLTTMDSQARSKHLTELCEKYFSAVNQDSTYLNDDAILFLNSLLSVDRKLLQGLKVSFEFPYYLLTREIAEPIYLQVGYSRAYGNLLKDLRIKDSTPGKHKDHVTKRVKTAIDDAGDLSDLANVAKCLNFISQVNDQRTRESLLQFLTAQPNYPKDKNAIAAYTVPEKSIPNNAAAEILYKMGFRDFTAAEKLKMNELPRDILSECKFSLYQRNCYISSKLVEKFQQLESPSCASMLKACVSFMIPHGNNNQENRAEYTMLRSFLNQAHKQPASDFLKVLKEHPYEGLTFARTIYEEVESVFAVSLRQADSNGLQNLRPSPV